MKCVKIGKAKICKEINFDEISIIEVRKRLILADQVFIFVNFLIISVQNFRFVLKCQSFLTNWMYCLISVVYWELIVNLKFQVLIYRRSCFLDRDFRFEASKVPFGYIFLNYCGPFTVKINNQNSKVWALCITHCFTRAVNLKIYQNLSVKEFFQLHIFEYCFERSINIKY